MSETRGNEATATAGGMETAGRASARQGEPNGRVAPRNVWARLQARWGVTPWGVFTILLAFALAGTTVLKISRPIVNAILPDGTPGWLWWTVKIVVILPIYEVLLMFYGTVLGQRRFFWEKQRRLLRALSRRLRKR
jgi:hypothetical protein